MDLGFVILCPDRRVGGLRNTLGSVACHAPGKDSVCVVGADATAADLAEMGGHAPALQAGATVTSLINKGLHGCDHEWAFIVFSGSRVCPYIETKFKRWVQKDSDILFPVVDRKWDFVEGTFNGVLINTAFFKTVGDFPAYQMEKAGLNDFELSKMFWAMDAVEKGATFKAIVGMKIL